MNPYTEFTCLYTSQKQKKAKTWHDGHVRFFHTNSKIVLYDTKFSVLDSSFNKGSVLAAGDDMEMDRHLVTVEEYTSTFTGNAEQMSGHSSASSTRPNTLQVTRNSQLAQQLTRDAAPALTTPSMADTKRKKWRAPFAAVPELPDIQSAPSTHPSQDVDLDDFHLDFSEQDFASLDKVAEETTVTATATRIKIKTTKTPTSITTAAALQTTSSLEVDRSISPTPPPKRRKVGLSRITPSALSARSQPSSLSFHRPLSTQLEFPSYARCSNFTGKNSAPKRMVSVGARFSSTQQYKDGMSYLIYDHLQVMVIEIAMALWNIKTTNNNMQSDALDAFYRARGIHMHTQTTLRKRGDTYAGFPIFSNNGPIAPSGPGSVNGSVVSPAAQQGAALSLYNKEHHSRYSKDDLWVVSKTLKFEASSTFFARSVFYGPSGNDVEISCLSSKDSNVARELFAVSSNVYAIRLFNAMSEFMMLDNLADGLTNTPLLPVLLSYVPPDLVKESKTAVFRAPSRIPEKTGCIVLTEEDNIDVELEVQNTIEHFHLNEEQATVLRNFALTIIRAPGWGSKSQVLPPVLLIHGVFGAGKSFLIAVLIVFSDMIINKARTRSLEERSCRFLVASMTNVAVDRILTALLDLGFTEFVRVGSLKKVARRILPFTAQSNSGRAGEEIKELQSILQEDGLSHRERQYVKDALKRFQKQENKGIVAEATVVGATCIASMFELLDGVSFPIVIMDEASQLLEPMSLVPLCRAAGEKLIMVGDPLQLAPPVTTNADKSAATAGYTRTLFDRATEMGIKPIMLKTQYRCHPRIAEISSSLFYSGGLKAGANAQDRSPLIQGLPTLVFIDHDGSEVQNSRTKSFTNPSEVRVVVDIVQRLLSLNIPGSDIGVISLYKSQAESIQSSLDEVVRASGLDGGSVQISTVDAFQGSEKEIIVVSTVRTENIGFIDNPRRVNVALTRSKRHLFLVGHSQLLQSNRLWSQVINPHCAGANDGMSNSNVFLQKLRTLVPLPKPAATVILEESEPEEEEEEELESRRSNRGRYEEEHESELSQESDNETLAEPVPAPRTGPRKYALYKADESDSNESDGDDMDTRHHRSRQQQKQQQQQQQQQPTKNQNQSRSRTPPPPMSWDAHHENAHQRGGMARSEPEFEQPHVATGDIMPIGRVLPHGGHDTTVAMPAGRVQDPFPGPVPVRAPPSDFGSLTHSLPVSGNAKTQDEYNDYRDGDGGRVEVEETVVWEMSEEDYAQYDAAHGQEDVVTRQDYDHDRDRRDRDLDQQHSHKDDATAAVSRSDSLNKMSVRVGAGPFSSDGYFSAPVLSHEKGERAGTEGRSFDMDSADMRYCASQRLEDLDLSWSMMPQESQALSLIESCDNELATLHAPVQKEEREQLQMKETSMAMTMAMAMTGERERDMDDEGQDLAMLEMDDF